MSSTKKNTNFKVIQKPKIHVTKLKKTNITDVWNHNFDEEMMKIIHLVEEFNVIAMVNIKIKLIIQDTEFPGVVKKPK